MTVPRISFMSAMVAWVNQCWDVCARGCGCGCGCKGTTSRPLGGPVPEPERPSWLESSPPLGTGTGSAMMELSPSDVGGSNRRGDS